MRQDMTRPITVGGDYLWWAQTWHMQTPLETLGAGSFVAFELREKVCQQLSLRSGMVATQNDMLSGFIQL